MAQSPTTENANVDGKASIQGVLIRHALDAPIEAVSVPLASLPTLAPESGGDALPSLVPSTSAADGPSSKPKSQSPYTELFLSLAGSSEVFPGDKVAVATAQSPFAIKVDKPILIIYNSGSKSPSNMRASRLTMALTTGVVTTICGSALVLGCHVPGTKCDTTSDANAQSSASSDSVCLNFSSVSLVDVEALDNAVHDEVMEYFCQGLAPREADLDRIVRAFREGVFRYGDSSVNDAEDGKNGKGEKNLKSGKAEGHVAGGGAKGAKNKKSVAKGKKATKGEETSLPGWGSGWDSA